MQVSGTEEENTKDIGNTAQGQTQQSCAASLPPLVLAAPVACAGAAACMLVLERILRQHLYFTLTGC